jgi:glycosyltransferase involved in cell wall biosynthesis
MCERLAARGHEVHLVTYGQGSAVEDRGFRHHRIRRLPGDDASRSGPRPLKPVLDALLARALVALLSRLRFDVVHCHNYEAAVVGLAARMRCKVPVVYHSHNLMGDELATYFGSRSSRKAAGVLGRLLDVTVPRAADHVIALCKFSADVLSSSGVSEDRIAVIAPAVDDCGPACDAARARAALGLRADGEVIGYCGNLDRYQNLELLLDAFGILARRRDARLLIATHAEDGAFARTIAERGLAERATVVNVQSWRDARRAMEACDVLVLPRRYGSGVPIKLLNYLSLGRPVVAAGCGSKVLVDGVDALLTADDDARALAGTLVRLLADGDARTRLGAAGRARFLRDFTWDAVLPAVERVYGRCGGGAAGYSRYEVGGEEP